MLDTMKSIQDGLKERFTSPFIGFLFFAWFFINYQVVFVSFSTLSVHEKISFINNYIKEDAYYLKLIFYPFFSAFFYITIFKAFDIAMYAIWLWNQTILNIISNKINRKRTVGFMDYVELRRKLEEADVVNEERVEKVTEEKNRLEEELKRVSEELRKLRGKFEEGYNMVVDGLSASYDEIISNPEYDDLDKDKIDAINEIQKYPGFDYFKMIDVLEMCLDSKEKAIRVLRELEKSGYIILEEKTIDGNSKIMLGEIGHAFLEKYSEY
ncbi:hypothetical protein [Marinobacterium iners]|uniref:Uncharacterized protein n=1 Tax=Marinobacterium iners DSM 11526 TaxID=1122198 RepID=A0A1H4GR80_9GAMM|nr:hypothetical protein [Marinobacterium iners]SEB12093.1 hypothetical protein SAMN02745729_11943 [Marinobacterium iners DSM 11526]